MMEPITATLTAAKEIYEAAKTIQKVYNVSKEMKTVAESEGKDQIMATKNLAGTAADMKKEAQPEGNEKSNNMTEIGNLHKDSHIEPSNSKGEFVDMLDKDINPDIPVNIDKSFRDVNTIEPSSDFVVRLDTDTHHIPVDVRDDNGLSSIPSLTEIEGEVFVDRLPLEEATSEANGLNEINDEVQKDVGEVKKRDPDRFSEKNQYADSERCQEYRNNPENEPLLEGYDKDANVLRRNMELVMGDDASEIDKSNSRAHHIVGDNEYSSESKAILEKYGIDINSPENGIFLPQNEESDLHGTIHEGKHTKAYNDEVTQRLRTATCKEDVLEILDSIKEDLYNGDMELYHDHKYNE